MFGIYRSQNPKFRHRKWERCKLFPFLSPGRRWSIYNNRISSEINFVLLNNFNLWIFVFIFLFFFVSHSYLVPWSLYKLVINGYSKTTSIETLQRIPAQEGLCHASSIIWPQFFKLQIKFKVSVLQPVIVLDLLINEVAATNVLWSILFLAL